MSKPDKHAALFRPAKPAPVTPQDRVDAAARQIIAEQTEKRADLTARLRAARLARAATAPPEKTAASKKRS